MWPKFATYLWLFGTRTKPSPMDLRSRSEYLRRAFSANFLVLNGFERGVR